MLKKMVYCLRTFNVIWAVGGLSLRPHKIVNFEFNNIKSL